MKIIFMGTPEFAVPALEALLASEHEMVAVYSQPPRPAGRGQKLRKSPIHELAEKNNIPVFTPTSLKSAEAQKEFAALNADVAVVVAYGLLLPQAILDAPKHGCINIHPSALPRWRGAAPIQRTIMAGDTTTEICIMQMDAGLDTGAVYKRSAPIHIPQTMNAGMLHDQLASDAAPVLLEVLDEIASGTAHATPQATDGVTYAQKISKEEVHIDWNRSATDIHNHIRGLSPFPGATATLNGEVLKIYKAKIVPSPIGGGLGWGQDKTHHYPLPYILKNARALRKGQTDAEKLMWRLLRGKQLGVKFRKQHPLGNYIADFLSIEAKLIIELDGGHHNEEANIKRDEIRSAFFNNQGFKVLRFWNNQILQDTDSVMEHIYHMIHPTQSGPHPNPPPMGEGMYSAGTTLDDKLTIACGEGAIQLLEVQKPGKPRMSADAFLRGQAVAKGSVFN